MVYNLGEQQTLLNTFIEEIRNKDTQTDAMRFRQNMERVGMVFAYEISKRLEYKKTEVQTPLGEAQMDLPQNKIVIGTILRAGLPMHNGMLSFFDKAENLFVSAYRKYGKDNSFDIQIEYISAPDLTGKTVILCDPMLATGSSMVLAYRAMLEKGKPAHVHIVSLIASNEGLEYCRTMLPKTNVSIWLGAIDDELTVKGYIVPGLGDAGDLAFGNKS